MIEIRRYDPRYWEDIQQVHDKSRMQELSFAGLPEAFLPLSVAAEREDLFGYSLYVAVENEKALGFVAFTEEELAWLYVDPDHQRKGIGRKLAQFALERMEPGEKTVEVLCGNEPAKRLYHSLGFVNEETLSGAMPGNEEFSVTVWRMSTM